MTINAVILSRQAEDLPSSSANVSLPHKIFHFVQDDNSGITDIRFVLRHFLLVGMLILCGCANAEPPVQFERAQIKVNNINLKVELAQSWEQRQRGLMFRKSLCQNCGMLFVFESPRIGSMWMKNTLIPLDVAYIDKSGQITDIKAMQPQDLTSIQSSKPILHALEMNQGWFAANGVKVGDKILIVDSAPR